MVRLIIDSASDILVNEAKEFGMIRLPMKVLFGDKEYQDGVDISHREFYEKLIESDEMPTTCQVPPAEFEEAYREVVENGDTAVVITVSSKVSGTYQSAMIAAQEFPGKIFVVDSENVCIGQRILSLRAMELLKEGLSAEELVDRLLVEKKCVRVLALLDTLEYLRKGGRVSAASAMVGGVLSIKPALAVEEGEVRVVGKARGSKKANNLLRELVQKCGGIDFDKPLALAYSGLSDELLKKYIADSAELWEGQTDKMPICTIGSAIGTHAGPGAIAVAFFEK